MPISAALSIATRMSPHKIGQAYYVDATGGNDANHGRTSDQAWQTIGKVNASTYNPGDRILFKRGETWTGTQLLPPSSGVSGKPITFAAYGAGNDPIIDGNDIVNCINANNQAYLAFEDIRATQGLDFGFEVAGTSHHIRISRCEADNCGNDNVIFIGSNVHDCSMDNVDSHDAYDGGGGIVATCLEIADGAHDIRVTDSEFYNCEDHGISIHGHAASDFPYNIVINNCTSRNNTGYGIQVLQDNAVLSVADANILISGCSFSSNTSSGIAIPTTGDPYPTGIVFDQCTSFGNTARPLVCGATSTFTRCAFRSTLQTYFQNCEDVVVHNCTFYRSASIPVQILGASLDGLEMRNCIIACAGVVPFDVDISTNVDIDYTMYDGTADIVAFAVLSWLGVVYNWADWKTNSLMDANSPIPADPLFVDPATNDFHLQAGSPARGVGIDVGFGADLGAFQYV